MVFIHMNDIGTFVLPFSFLFIIGVVISFCLKLSKHLNYMLIHIIKCIFFTLILHYMKQLLNKLDVKAIAIVNVMTHEKCNVPWF